MMPLRQHILLSPMAGISDYPFREICRGLGAQGSCVQLLSAHALTNGSDKTHRMVDLKPHELADTGIQIFGGDADMMAEGIRILSQYEAAFIDINMGCSVPKIMRSEGGAYLLCEPARAGEVFTKAVKATHLPVTVKTRLGPSHDNYTLLEVAKRAEDAGIQAIALHARTVSDKFAGQAKWEWIARLKETVSIPVLGNGDLHQAEDIPRMFQETGCDAVLVARGAMGDPWIFQRARALMAGEKVPPPPTAREVLQVAEKHHRMMVEQYEEPSGTRQMRKHYGWYLKYFPDATTWREKFMRVEDLPQAIELLGGLAEWLHSIDKLDRPARPEGVVHAFTAVV